MRCTIRGCREEAPVGAYWRHFCPAHEREWLSSFEHARVVTAVADFVRRVDAERLNSMPPSPPAKPSEAAKAAVHALNGALQETKP